MDMGQGGFRFDWDAQKRQGDFTVKYLYGRPNPDADTTAIIASGIIP